MTSWNRGVIKVNEEVGIVGFTEKSKKIVVIKLEMFRTLLDESKVGNNIGVLLRGVTRDGIEKGQILAKPGTLFQYLNFESKSLCFNKRKRGTYDRC